MHKIILAAPQMEERSQTVTAPVPSATKLQLEVFRSLPTTHVKTKANKMCPLSSHTCVCLSGFTCVYLHAQITVDTCDTGTWWITVILITGKTRSRITHLCLWAAYTNYYCVNKVVNPQVRMSPEFFSLGTGDPPRRWKFCLSPPTDRRPRFLTRACPPNWVLFLKMNFT